MACYVGHDAYSINPSYIKKFMDHSCGISALQYDISGKVLASSSFDGLIRITDFVAPLRSYGTSDEMSYINSICWSPDSKLIASANDNGIVKLWQVNGELTNLTEHIAHEEAVNSINFHPKGDKLVTASNDKFVKIWQVKDFVLEKSFDCQTEILRSAKFNYYGDLLATCDEAGVLRIYDIATSQCTHRFPRQNGIATQLCWHPYGNLVAVSYSSGHVRIFCLNSYLIEQQHKYHYASANDLAFHPTGKFLVSAGSDATLRVWDMRKQMLIKTLFGHCNKVCSVCFTDDGFKFASGGADGRIITWNTNLQSYEDPIEQTLKQVIKTLSECSLSDSGDEVNIGIPRILRIPPNTKNKQYSFNIEGIAPPLEMERPAFILPSLDFRWHSPDTLIDQNEDKSCEFDKHTKESLNEAKCKGFQSDDLNDVPPPSYNTAMRQTVGLGAVKKILK